LKSFSMVACVVVFCVVSFGMFESMRRYIYIYNIYIYGYSCEIYVCIVYICVELCVFV